MRKGDVNMLKATMDRRAFAVRGLTAAVAVTVAPSLSTPALRQDPLELGQRVQWHVDYLDWIPLGRVVGIRKRLGEMGVHIHFDRPFMGGRAVWVPREQVEVVEC